MDEETFQCVHARNLTIHVVLVESRLGTTSCSMFFQVGQEEGDVLL